MDLIEQIKRDEGLRLKPYVDTTGHLTVGYGHNLAARGITPEIAAMLLEEDIAIAIAGLRQKLPWFDHLSPARQGVLINMCFNLGIGDADKQSGLLGFTGFLGCLEAGDIPGAKQHLLNSLWRKQVGGRALRLVQQLESDEWV